MKRFLIAAVLSLSVLSGRLPAQVEVQVQPRLVSKADSNREIIELLKQVIQKLEAQNAPKVQEAPKAQLEAARKELEAVLKAQRQKVLESNTELMKAQQELEEARKRLKEAEARVRKLQGSGWMEAPRPGQPAKAVQVPGAWKVITIDARNKSTPEPKREALEKRLDALMRQIEDLRREIKNSR